MEKIEILVVGKHPEIMKTIQRLLNGKGWNCALAFNPDEAIKHGSSIPFNIVLLGAGLSEDEAQQVREHFTVPVVQHYGGGSGLLYAEVYEALGNNPSN